MQTLHYACFWPGLASAWHRGAALGLLLAVSFSWLISLLVLATFVWTEWLAGWFLGLMWFAAAGFWFVDAVRSNWTVAKLFDETSDEAIENYATAQTEYLKGNWFEAEAILLEIVRQQPRDVPANLLLIGVLRHSCRFRSALRRLEQLSLLDGASAWRFEIQQEQRLIRRQMDAEAQNDSGDNHSGDDDSQSDGVEEPAMDSGVEENAV